MCQLYSIDIDMLYLMNTSAQAEKIANFGLLYIHQWILCKRKTQQNGYTERYKEDLRHNGCCLWWLISQVVNATGVYPTMIWYQGGHGDGHCVLGYKKE